MIKKPIEPREKPAGGVRIQDRAAEMNMKN